MKKQHDNKILIQIVDGNHRPIFTWRPGNGNVALGLRKGCEVAIGKLGLEDELKRQGIVLKEKEQATEAPPCEARPS